MTPVNWDYLTLEYQAVANLILDNMIKTRKRNYMVFPLIFLYRHYIELMLKEIILNNWEYQEIEEDFPSGHNIYELWGMCRKALKETDKLVDPGFAKSREYVKQIIGAYDALEADLHKFAEVDPDSQHFRYPVDKYGNPIEVDDKLLIELLRELPEVVKRISYNLDGISTGIDTILQDKYNGLAE